MEALASFISDLTSSDTFRFKLCAKRLQCVKPVLLNPNPAIEKSRFVREGRRTVVV